MHLYHKYSHFMSHAFLVWTAYAHEHVILQETAMTAASYHIALQRHTKLQQWRSIFASKLLAGSAMGNSTHYEVTNDPKSYQAKHNKRRTINLPTTMTALVTERTCNNTRISLIVVDP